MFFCVFWFFSFFVFHNEHLPRASTRGEPEVLRKATLDQMRQPSNHTQILHQSTIMIIKINCASFFRKTTTTRNSSTVSSERTTDQAETDFFLEAQKKARPDRQARCKCVFLRRKGGGGGGAVFCHTKVKSFLFVR